MNDRLRDKRHDPDPVLARAAELADSVPPLAPSAARKQRVRQAVLASGRRRSWMPVLLRPSVAVPVLLFAGVVLGATLGRSLLVEGYRRLSAVGPAAPTESRPQPKQPAPVLNLLVAREKGDVLDLLPVGPPADVAGLPAKAEPRHGPEMRAHKPSKAVPAKVERASEPAPAPEVQPEAPAAARPAPAQETLLIMKAVHALRREHDAKHAGVLLDDYLHRFPNGVLTEEALALAIEAASAAGDARAAGFARTYLQRYPNGRFQKAARAAAP